MTSHTIPNHVTYDVISDVIYDVVNVVFYNRDIIFEVFLTENKNYSGYINIYSHCITIDASYNINFN